MKFIEVFKKPDENVKKKYIGFFLLKVKYNFIQCHLTTVTFNKLRYTETKDAEKVSFTYLNRETETLTVTQSPCNRCSNE